MEIIGLTWISLCYVMEAQTAREGVINGKVLVSCVLGTSRILALFA